MKKLAITLSLVLVMGVTVISGCSSKPKETAAPTAVQSDLDAQKATMERETPGSTQPATAPR